MYDRPLVKPTHICRLKNRVTTLRIIQYNESATTQWFSVDERAGACVAYTSRTVLSFADEFVVVLRVYVDLRHNSSQ